MEKSLYVALFLIINSLAVKGGSFQSRVEQLIRDNNYARKTVGVMVTDIERDSVLVSCNPDKLFNPASVMKLITGAAALELLGVGHSFKTTVYIDSTFDRNGGILHGNLYIRGGGDPGFLAERMWLFVQQLRHRGLQKITGDLILDDTYFDTDINGPGFGEDASTRAYNAPIAALSANFNTVAVHVTPGGSIGAPIIITPFPGMKGVKIITTAKTSPAGTSARLSVKTELMDGKTAVLVYGDMSLDEKPRYIFRKVWNTWESFGWICQGLFEECGILFNGMVRHEAVFDSLKTTEPFYTFESRPLPLFIFNMFKYSSNFSAEMLFKSIASEYDSLPGSWESGARVVSQWWGKKRYLRRKTKSIPVVKNGSGMGGGNRVSARHITSLLEYVWQNKSCAPEFVYALSIAGVDGTLQERFTTSHLKGIVRAKTGTLNSRGVSNLAGYILLPKRTYAFAVLVNNREQSQFSHWTLQQRILETVVRRMPKKKRAKKQR